MPHPSAAQIIRAVSRRVLRVSKSEETDNDTRLAEDKKVFIEKSEREADVAMGKELQKWGRWKLVADDSEADLLIRMRVSGNAFWGVGRVQVYILDAKTKETIWVSKSQKGTRTIFRGYASPFTRAISGIVKQMREELE